MQCNMGKTDRIIRTVLGVALLGWGVMNSCIIADIVGVLLLITAAIGWCPPYALLGINTGCDIEKKENKDQPKEH
ncbi:YgaP family membrane protein [Sulfurovum mangrovi]|uniref:YgaP family membrane protein n=1 Tax=Sulfurovum mangrovi TaxID=2893889 RepID=UPI001E2C6A02|nr:DUF2892 domain-containing protein [Sulfurovum mangrovi]UFH58752.1 DUF2892 domain-containing protein [Sulfurovum mangrovi]